MNVHIYNLYKRLKSEKAEIVIEYTIILPIVFVIIMILLWTAFMVHQKATLESAANRGAIYAAKMMSDPWYNGVTKTLYESEYRSVDFATDRWDFSINQKIEPYSGLFGGKSVDDLKTAAKNYTKNIIDATSIPLFLSKDSLSVEAEIDISMIFFKNVVITAKRAYQLPAIVSIIGLPSTYDVEAVSVVAVNDPAEFIRNIDFAGDIVMRLKAPVKGILDKIDAFMSKFAFK